MGFTDELLPQWMLRVEGKVDNLLTLVSEHGQYIRSAEEKATDQERRLRALETGTVTCVDCNARHAIPATESARRRDILRTGTQIAQWIVALAALGCSGRAIGLF